jgi:nitrite reductase/ring-hydroxylating ferredoxin subunit
MADQPDDRSSERVDRLVGDLLSGRHLKATPNDAGERDAIQVAARLAGTRDGYPRMSSPFRRRLARMLERGRPDPTMDRRAMLLGGLGLAAGVASGALAMKVDQAVSVPPPPAVPPTPHPGAPLGRSFIQPLEATGRWVDTGFTVDELVEGIPLRAQAGSVGAFLVRVQGMVTAMSAYCTHLPCELVWQPDSHVLNCPCHNLPFDINGNALGSYPMPQLPVVKVRVVKNRIEILGT